MKGKKVGVLMGGLSAEREISLKTGEAVAQALSERGHDVARVFVDRDVDIALRQAQVDVAFLAVHGRYGEDGCLQGLLEMLGIPYTGSDVLASALAMNKVRAKEIFRLHNIPTPPYYVLTRERAAALADEHAGFGFPAVVKPAGEGSSVGVAVCRTFAELETAVEEALRFDGQVLIERFIVGKEISVGILGDQPLAAVEVVPRTGFYNYSNKYTAGKTDYHLPARLSPERYRGVLTTALLAHRALGARGATRVDLMVSERGNESVLEVNTLPGMTPTSLLPKMAGYVGLSFADLCEEILGGAALYAHGRTPHERRVAQRPYTGSERRALGTLERH